MNNEEIETQMQHIVTLSRLMHDDAHTDTAQSTEFTQKCYDEQQRLQKQGNPLSHLHSKTNIRANSHAKMHQHTQTNTLTQDSNEEKQCKNDCMLQQEIAQSPRQVQQIDTHTLQLDAHTHRRQSDKQTRCVQQRSLTAMWPKAVFEGHAVKNAFYDIHTQHTEHNELEIDRDAPTFAHHLDTKKQLVEIQHLKTPTQSEGRKDRETGERGSIVALGHSPFCPCKVK